jgi:L-fuculose-phosphate aldolase
MRNQAQLREDSGPMSQSHIELKQKLIDAGRILDAEGQADLTRGHVSIRLPDQPDLFIMKPHSIGFDEITLDNILTIDLDGNVVAGTARRHSEVFIHTEIFRARPDVNSVIHTHPDYTVAFSATGRPMRALSQPSSLYADNLGMYTDTIDLIRTADMGKRVAEALGSYPAVLLRNHGAVMCGATIEEAVIRLIMLENACRIQLLAEAAGPLGPEFPPEDVEKLRYNLTRPDQFIVNFDYLRRRLARH